MRLRVAIIGAGFAGLGAAIRLGAAGLADVTVYERAPTLGGTWRDNTYPGCACDIPSLLYSFSFAPNPDWSRLYPPQAEIRAYLEKVAEDFGLRERLRFEAELAEAVYDESASLWRLRFADGRTAEAEVLVGATGPLSKPALPRIEGRSRFEGIAFHSSRWPAGLDLAGKRVAVIGTGASAIQLVPRTAATAASVAVYQRTPPWVLPHRDRALAPWERRLFRAVPAAQRLRRWLAYLRQELLVFGFLGGARVQERFRRFALWQLERQVADPNLRAALTPDYAPGCKRLLISNDWYPALQRPNVELVPEAVARLEGRDVVTASGARREADVVVFATGFAATEFVSPLRIVGRGGRELGATWKQGAATHLGIAVAGFPNLFLLVGPNTGLGHNSLVFMIEAQLNYLEGALRELSSAGTRVLEVKPEAQARSYAEVQARMKATVWASGCRSWYLSADGRNDTLWPGSTIDYWRRTRRFDRENYA